jgi:hypothetical protein
LAYGQTLALCPTLNDFSLLECRQARSPSNSHFDLWGSGQRFVEGEGGQELLPRGEDEVDGDGSQVAEKSGASVDFGSGFLPRLIGEVGDGVASECQEIENDEHRG